MIEHLQQLKDPVVTRLKPHELNPIMFDNCYHSPEVSESDEENLGEARSGPRQAQEGTRRHVQGTPKAVHRPDERWRGRKEENNETKQKPKDR